MIEFLTRKAWTGKFSVQKAFIPKHIRTAPLSEYFYRNNAHGTSRLNNPMKVVPFSTK